VAWANEEGYAEKLRGYDWDSWDSLTITQPEQDFLEDEISPFLLTKTKAEFLEEAVKRRLLLAPVSTIDDLPQNPQLIFREFWVKVFHPELNDTLTYPGPSVKVDGCPQQIHRRAPLIGEHNREIYGGELGLSRDDLDLLKAQGVI
jgi:crotonobetainyl-CoA:carnitine CoA-transferase CaiB-like acyl-CoA transferase